MAKDMILPVFLKKRIKKVLGASNAFLHWQNRHNETNVIVTGIPRSGTTLSCYLLNQLPDTIALNEPVYTPGFDHRYSALFEISICFYRMRQSLLNDGTALARSVKGKIPDNSFENVKGRKRKSIVRKRMISFKKDLSENFLLAIKDPLFSFLLPRLMEIYPCYVIIRNPLSVLASWNSVTAPVSRGRTPVAERLDPGFRRSLEKIPDLFDRQIFILSCYFEKYLEFVPPAHILRYEDIVASGGRSLQVITQKAADLDMTLKNKNKNKLYDFKLMKEVGEKLLNTDGPYWEFYSRENVKSLLKTFEHV